LKGKDPKTDIKLSGKKKADEDWTIYAMEVEDKGEEHYSAYVN